MTEQNAVGLDFKRFIVEETNRQWVTRGEPVLLAKLGQIAASRGFILHNELNGLKLSQFIQQELSDELEVMSPNASGTVLGVGPKNPPIPQLSPTAPITASPLDGLTRAVVAAFTNILRDGYERYLRTEPPLRYQDVVQGEAAPEGYVHIQRVHLPTDGSPPDAYLPDCIHAQITAWIEQQSLDLQSFMHKGAAQPRSEKSVLTLLIESLTESELKRVSLPLDIIGKLMGK
jgi:hypothetical protein